MVKEEEEEKKKEEKEEEEEKEDQCQQVNRGSTKPHTGAVNH